MVSNLENSIIFGIILVVGVLLFFLGLRNALFVGVAIPLSMLMSFMILNALGVTLNVMVLFSLVLALGMLVDNGIVIVENI
jgi:multidrug efflux pump subunit AcrB